MGLGGLLKLRLAGCGEEVRRVPTRIVTSANKPAEFFPTAPRATLSLKLDGACAQLNTIHCPSFIPTLAAQVFCVANVSPVATQPQALPGQDTRIIRPNRGAGWMVAASHFQVYYVVWRAKQRRVQSRSSRTDDGYKFVAYTPMPKRAGKYHMVVCPLPFLSPLPVPCSPCQSPTL